MPAISKIRFTNIVYEDGNKRYNDETFHFDGHNGAILLENGGGKTVFIQTALQAVLPHADLAGRKIKETFSLENGPAHVAIEWIVHERPRRYAVTCVTLFLTSSGLDSIRYVYDYPAHDPDNIDEIPFVKQAGEKSRPAEKGEIQDYYQAMCAKRMNAHTFPTIKSYHQYLEEQLHIIAAEWEWIAKINQSEGGIEHFFDECKTTTLLFDRLLIPVVEASMLGYSEGKFSEMFQNHRDGFKKYKQLKEKVEENKRILQELDSCVEAYEKQHVKQNAYATLQSEAKAYWQAAHRQQEEQRGELANAEEQLRQWNGRKDRLLETKDSLHIARQKQELAAQQTKHALVEDEKRLIEDELDSTGRQYVSLRYADYRSQKLEAEERGRSAENKLTQLTGTSDEQELAESWLNNSGRIRYLLSAQEQKLNAEKGRLTEQREDAVKKLASDELQLKRMEAELRGFEDESLRLRTSAEEKERMRDDIRKQVLANAAVERVEDKLAYWIKRANEMDETIVSLTQSNKELAIRKGKDQAELERIQALIREASEERSRLQERLDRQQQAHETVRAELKSLRPIWERLQSVYDRQSSIERQLDEDIEQLSSEKERLLYKERLAYRFVDDYAGQEMFFADPYAAELLKKWANQFALLQTGIEYLADIGMDGTSSSSDRPAQPGHTISNPLWSATLITVEDEKQALCRKLAEHADHFQYPVRVISTSEASLLAQGRPFDEAGVWIEPRHWRTNADRAVFDEWKRNAADAANGSKEERLLQEQKLRRWVDAQKAVDLFLDEYPLEKVQQMEADLLAEKDNVRRLTHEAMQMKSSIENADALIEENVKKSSDYKEECSQLARWIEQGQRYAALGREIQLIRNNIEQIREQAGLLQTKIDRHKRECEALRKQEQLLLEEQRRVAHELGSLQAQDLYTEVSEYSALATDESLERLKAERSDLYLRRQRISQSRRELETELKAAVDKKSMMDQEMTRLLAERADILPDMEFPLNGRQLMERLLETMRQQQEKAKRLGDEYARMNREYVGLETKVKLLVEQYAVNHQGEEPHAFMEPLNVVADRLDADEAALTAEKRDLDRLEAQHRGQLDEIGKAILDMTPYKLLHGFENPIISPVLLTDAAVSEFSYRRRQAVKEMMSRLVGSYEAAEAEKERLGKARDRFKSFCRKQIKDVKLREMAEQGVEQSETYETIVAFQQSMQTRINHANHIAEEYMRTHNQDLEQYIVHVHSHLKQVVSELKEIPNKTKVKTDNEWKPIYTFAVPEWEEQEGKGAIRQHLDWILDQLDKEKYRDEQGQELDAAVKKDLDKWLDTKQLLQVVLRDKAMKVSCRKVTNENNLTKASYSWEQSNNWSGGEKWSKNMTLFLGLLNYTAEKRRHIQSGMKRHRSVILDNPFGKASSDHVLSPVFFIAEQLGFQVIALTAHASGKFLQDYFPVVFSCKLRQAAGSEKQIMTKEKTINQAYFRDHAPLSLERLGDVAQMELF